MSGWIFITGGAGYLGSHLAAQIKTMTDHSVMVIDRKGKDLPHATRYCDVFADEDFTSKIVSMAIRDYRPKFVIHCADEPLRDRYLLDPIGAWKQNVSKTIELLECCASSGVENFMFLSSGSIYRDGNSPISEMSEIAPSNAYSRSKLAIEHLLKDCYIGHGIGSISFRTFGIAGCHNLYDLGHLPGSPYLIPRLIESALGRGTLEVMGRSQPTPDGTPVRDYLHVMDLCDAVVRSLSWLEENPGAHCINLASGTGTSVQQIIDLSEDLLGRKIPYVYGDRSAVDPPSRIADVSIVRDLLNWTPRRSISDMILDSYKWASSPEFKRLLVNGVRHD